MDTADRHHESIRYSLLDDQELQVDDDDAHFSTQQVKVKSMSSTRLLTSRLRGPQRVVFVVALSIVLLILIWLLSNMEIGGIEPPPMSPLPVVASSSLRPAKENSSFKPDGSKKASDLVTSIEKNYDWFEDNCYGQSQLTRSVADIYKKLELLKISSVGDCHQIWTIFNNMLRIESVSAPIVLPLLFQAEVKGWLKDDESLFDQVNHQVVYKIVNKGTYEESVFNPIRSKRPVSKSDVDPLEYIRNLTESTAPNCDFCNYKDHTAEDTFGRIDNKYSASSSNTFKLAKFHGLFFPKVHNPLNISLVQLQDLFLHTSKQWFAKAHETDPEQRYPSILWDTLPHAGASQVHPHIHGVLDTNQYVGGFESWHQVSIQYFQKFQRSYWSDFVKLHFALGLGISRGNAVAIVPLPARKDHEYMLLSSELNEDFVNLLHNVLQAYQRKLDVYCFSSAGVYPKIGENGGDDGGMPVVFRIGSRGTCSSIGSDVSSLELYTLNNINTDLEKTYHGLYAQIMELDSDDIGLDES